MFNLFLDGPCHKSPQKQHIYSLVVLETRTLKLRCQQGCAPAEVLGEGDFPLSTELLGIAHSLWLEDTLQFCDILDT